MHGSQWSERPAKVEFGFARLLRSKRVVLDDAS